LPGNVVDSGGVERQTAGIDGGYQFPGALFSGRWLATRQPGLEPMNGSFGKHVKASWLKVVPRCALSIMLQKNQAAESRDGRESLRAFKH
jgi:hypothetical protein